MSGREVVKQQYQVVTIDKLTPHPENPRRGQVGAILASMDSHGFYGAVVAQRSTGHVLAGNHRLAAAIEAGLKRLPVVWLDVDDDEARRILLADNRASDLATYDEAALADLLGSLEVTDAALAGTLFAANDATLWRQVTYDTLNTGKPLALGHYLVSYPLEMHGEVAAVIEPLGADGRVVLRHAPSQ